jgi:GT2 family glycosyltransferase
MWTGALVPREVREAVGPVNGELFIRGEDEEYPWRIEQAGFAQEAVRGSVLDHPGPAGIRRWTLGGRSLFFEPGLADWKLYYKVRNMVWLKRRQRGTAAAAAMAAAYALAVLVHGTGRAGALKVLGNAVRDGFAGRLGPWRRGPI